MGILRPEALGILRPELSMRARAPELSFRARANADLLAASATGSPIVALVGLEGAGKSFTLRAFCLSHPRGVAKIRQFGCLRDPDVEFDLVDDFDAHRSDLRSASENFTGTQILAMRPERLSSLREDYPEALVVTVQPMSLPDITLMIELLQRQWRLRRDVFTIKAKAALKNLCEANPKKLELLMGGAERFAHAEESPRISADHVERAARQWLLATHKVCPPKISIDRPAKEIIPATLKPKTMPRVSETAVSIQAVTPPAPMPCPEPKSVRAIFDTDPPELPELAEPDVRPAIVLPTQNSPSDVKLGPVGATAWEQLSAPMTMKDIARVQTARRRLEQRRFIGALGCTTLVAGLAYAFGAGAFSSLEVAGARWFVSVERTVTDFSVSQARLSLPDERPEQTSSSNVIKEAALSGKTPKVLPTASQTPVVQRPSPDIILKPLPPAVALSVATDAPPQSATPREVPFTLPPPPPILDDRFGRAVSPVFGGVSLASALPPLSILDLPKTDLIKTGLIGFLSSQSPAVAASASHDARLAVPFEAPQKLQAAAALQPPAQASAMMSKTSRADDAERLLMLARSLFAIGQVDDAKGMLQAAADMGNADAIDAIRQATLVKPVRSNRIAGQSSSTISGGRNQGIIDRRQ